MDERIDDIEDFPWIKHNHRDFAPVEVLSLGWNCDPAILSVQHGLRPNREGGYKTGPFDLMMSNYDGLVQCLEEDFARFLDVNFDNNSQIWNSIYGFCFNHESPHQFDDLGFKEGWTSPKHFIDNHFEKFTERYSARIENFRNYLNSERPKIFIHQGHWRIPYEVDEVLSRKYPEMKYRIICSTNNTVENEVAFLAQIGKFTASPAIEPVINMRVGNCLPCHDIEKLPEVFDYAVKELL